MGAAIHLPETVDLNDLHLFALIMRYGGYTAASDATGIPKSRISRRLLRLEELLGVRLLHRTSRRVRPTEAGQELYTYCSAMLENAVAGIESMRRRQAEPSGRVRIGASEAISNFMLSDLLSHFMSEYPQVSFRLLANLRQVDIIGEDFDIVVRGVGHEQVDSELVSINLCTVRWGVLASPTYLATHSGSVDCPERLGNSTFLAYSTGSEEVSTLHLHGEKGAERIVPVRTRLHSDNLQTIKRAALDGLGIAGLPLYSCMEELADGRLTVLVPQWRPRAGNIVALVPTRYGMPPAVRALLDFLKRELPRKLKEYGVDER